MPFYWKNPASGNVRKERSPRKNTFMEEVLFRQLIYDDSGLFCNTRRLVQAFFSMPAAVIFPGLRSTAKNHEIKETEDV